MLLKHAFVGLVTISKSMKDRVPVFSNPSVMQVYEVDVPVSNFEDDFEYDIEMQADEKTLSYPATAKEINCSVVVF